MCAGGKKGKGTLVIFKMCLLSNQSYHSYFNSCSADSGGCLMYANANNGSANWYAVGIVR